MEFVGVAGRDSTEAMQAFIDSTGVGGFEHIADLDGSAWATFEVTTQPAFVFVDDQGVVTQTGALGASGLTERVEALLAN